MASGLIPPEIIDEIQTRSDIVEVIGNYVPLKKAGSNSWKACCPFHNEKTPSFHVRGDKQVFYCFGCHKGGNVFKFVMEKEGITF
ncbi:MAG: DNA primase, partial [Lentisphaeria bacterium]|nr:DNA primase [Lentisphaeria bacterium]